MKAKMKLTFENWKPDSDKPTLVLGSTDDDPNSSTVFNGDISIPKEKMYEILRAAKEMGKKPMFVLEIVD